VPWLHPNITNSDGQQTRQHGVQTAENKKASKKLAFFQLNYSRASCKTRGLMEAWSGEGKKQD
jgi:hypothetical protein